MQVINAALVPVSPVGGEVEVPDAGHNTLLRKV